MDEFAVIWEGLTFAVRWLHVIAGIAWIGSSFYFIALDLGLRKAENLPAGAHGEEWQVHGGGFYHIRKYLVAPEAMPEHLTWFKWESYTTWLSGIALLSLVYYGGADLYLVDPAVMDITPLQGVVISAASLALGWLLYSQLCKFMLHRGDTLLMIALYVILVVIAWGYTQVFTGRAAFLHLGAITATIMTANVFFVIIPNQKIVVEDLRAGRTPDAVYGRIAKQRSTHNNYLTLPVVFLMLSNHYPLAFATEFNWIIASLVFLMGVTIRHYFNTIHARKGDPAWTWALTAILFILVMWLSSMPKVLAGETGAMGPRAQKFAAAEGFTEIADTVRGRCSMCHAAEPVWEGIVTAPNGVVLETDAQIAVRARDIYLQAARSTAMPPANASFMEDDERRAIRAWFEGAASGKAGSSS
ncbi:MAG: urate hydroxylase PuuD [Paracoccaceae bacterium]